MAKTERKTAKTSRATRAAHTERSTARPERAEIDAARRQRAGQVDEDIDAEQAEGSRAPSTRSARPARAGAKTGPKKVPAEVTRAVRAALDKKALDVVLLDLRHTPAFTDFFVLCSGANQRQVKAIADAVEESLRAAKVRPAHTEGYDRAEWVLLDFFTFIVHVFTPQTRAFYSLERLWGDAERIEVSDEPAK